MYEKKILKTLLSGQSNSSFSFIAERGDVVFPDGGDLDLYNMISNYFIDYSKVPRSDYLQEYFALEKNSAAFKSYTALEDEPSEISEDLDALILTQINFISKARILGVLDDYSNNLRLCSNSELPEEAFKLQDEIASINQSLVTNGNQKGLLSKDENVDKFRAKFKDRVDSDRGYYVAKTGFRSIDDTIGGIHSADKITFLGYTNQGKSPLLRQIAYNMLIEGSNIMFVTLEMNFDSIENSFYVLHANNKKIFGIKTPKITTSKIKEGNVNKAEYSFLVDSVVEDFSTKTAYGSVYVTHAADGATLDELMLDVNRVNQTVMPLDALFIDYAIPLLSPGRTELSQNKDSYNAMHRRLRQFGLNFDGGRGIPILDAAQANRKGYTDAVSPLNQGNLYNLTAIGDYNAIERDSTHVISVLRTPDMQVSGTAQIQALKSRESSFFPTFTVQMDGSTGGVTESLVKESSDEDLIQTISELDI